jgi:hypothetical protein
LEQQGFWNNKVLAFVGRWDSFIENTKKTRGKRSDAETCTVTFLNDATGEVVAQPKIPLEEWEIFVAYCHKRGITPQAELLNFFEGIQRGLSPLKRKSNTTM